MNQPTTFTYRRVKYICTCKPGTSHVAIKDCDREPPATSQRNSAMRFDSSRVDEEQQ